MPTTTATVPNTPQITRKVDMEQLNKLLEAIEDSSGQARTSVYVNHAPPMPNGFKGCSLPETLTRGSRAPGLTTF